LRRAPGVGRAVTSRVLADFLVGGLELVGRRGPFGGGFRRGHVRTFVMSASVHHYTACVSPRSSATEARKTRAHIAAHAADLASVSGLEGLSIGRLAGDLGMSKAGVVGPFGSKRALQIAAVEHAEEVFLDATWRAAAHEEPGLRRLLAFCERWFVYMEQGTFPGGCFFVVTGTEFAARPGDPVNRALAESEARLMAVLTAEVATAVDRGQLPPATEAGLVVFEIGAVVRELHRAIQLRGDATAGALARRALARILGL
jgi:AcrR family transcriptional regulator